MINLSPANEPVTARPPKVVLRRALSNRPSSARPIMTHDDKPHRIFRISELTMLIAGQLILTSPKSTMDLARTCRYLEEPVLSVLWQTQPWLDTLLKVLPEKTWSYNPVPGKSVVRGTDPPFEELNVQVWCCFSSG